MMPTRAAVIGTFDGVHRGHRFLIEFLKERARQGGMQSSIYTFPSHPLAHLCPDRAPKELTTADEKLSLLEQTGVDTITMTPFGDIAHLTARQYIELLAGEGVKLIIIGHDNRFGSDRLTTVSEYQEAARGTGVTIEAARELMIDGKPVNSSVIRELLSRGNILSANNLLGYEYNLTGTVVTGQQLGRTIGFPTANVQLPPGSEKLIPGNGVYACVAHCNDIHVPAMLNIGHRPTVERTGGARSIEAHLIGFDGDIYGSEATLTFIARLRDERRFASLGELQSQLKNDRSTVLNIINEL